VTAATHGGFNKVVFSEIDPCIFYASSTIGNLLVIDVRSGNIIRTYRGHMAPINDFIEVIQHKILVTAGDDFSCNVYDLTKEPKVGGEIKQEGEK
jgi:WD40 repeat protein